MRSKEAIQKDLERMGELESSVTNELLLDIRELLKEFLYQETSVRMS
jgi:hypothetical protein